MSKKNKKEKIDDGLETLLQTFQPKQITPGRTVFYMSSAVFISILPAYLFKSVYELSVSEFGLIYLLVTLLSSVMLAMAYHNIADTTNAKLSNARKTVPLNPKKLNYQREELEKIQEMITERESITWSLLYNNSIYLMGFLFLAFYAFREIAPHYTYMVSVNTAAVIAWWLSTAMK